MINELQEENRALLEMLAGADMDPPVSGLTRIEARILSGLLTHERLTREAIYIISGSRADDGGKIVDVFICRLRKKIAPLGLEIKNIWGEGYFIPREQREAAKEKLVA